MRKLPTAERTVATLKQTREESAYLAFLAERADAGRRDSVRFTNDQVNERMRTIRARRGA